MCDPVTITATALMAAGTGANAIAGSKARKSAKKTMLANLAQQKVSFDKRMNLQRESDTRTMGIEQNRYKDTSLLEDGTFAYMLEQSKQHADDNALEDQGLVTKQTQINNERVQSRTLESARQSGFLTQITGEIAAAVGKAMPGSQAAMTAANFAQRLQLMDKAIQTSGTTGTLAADDLVKAAFAARQDAARSQVMSEAAAGSEVEAIQNSATWADQLLQQGKTRADLIGDRAELSKRQLAGEEATFDARDELAQAHNSFAKGLNDWLEGARTSAYGDYATKAGDDLGNYYGRSLQSEKDYTDSMIGANQTADDTRTSLANYRIGSTQANTTLGDLLKVAGQGVAMYGANVAGKPPKPKTPTFTSPNNSAVLSGRAARAGNPTAPGYGWG